MIVQKDKLWTTNFICCSVANFLMFFSFYLLLPTLPFYLTEHFHCSTSLIGLVLSSYMIAALLIRPFSGYMVDMFARKPLYMFAQFIFIGVYIGYPLAATVLSFIIIRSIHGLAFGSSSVASNTLVIDIMPSSRRGEGLGYFGLSNNLAMAFGPMTGLFMHDYMSFDLIFLTALLCCICAMGFTSLIKAPVKPPVARAPLSLDRLLMIAGIPAGISLLLLAIPYGMTTSYVAMYGKELGVTAGSGLFFSLMAVGLMISRLLSGKMVDKGFLTKMISVGMVQTVVAFLLLGGLEYIAVPLLVKGLYYLIAFFIGFSFGLMFPAYNSLFVNLAPNCKRGTASSTYLTSWDIGIGIGLLMGGRIGDTGSFSFAFLIGSLLCLLSFLYFVVYVAPHFHRHKLR
ncbi:MAG: MFS transporter [Bacteroidales bacterium]|nr:MFS transporter [Bacteroidales bacterium]